MSADAAVKDNNGRLSTQNASTVNMTPTPLPDGSVLDGILPQMTEQLKRAHDYRISEELAHRFLTPDLPLQPEKEMEIELHAMVTPDNILAKSKDPALESLLNDNIECVPRPKSTQQRRSRSR